MTVRQWGWLLLLSVLWGGSFYFVAVAVRELPVLTIVLVRVALASAVLVPVVLAMGYRLPSGWRDWLPFLGMSLLNNVVPFLAIVSGQTLIPSGLAAVLNATTPMWAVALAWAVLGERPAANRIAGLIAGVVGVAILVGPITTGDGRATVIGAGLILLGACSYGLSALWGRRLAAHPPIVTTAAQLTGSTVMLLPVTMLVDKPWTLPVPGIEAMAALVGLAVLSTAVAYIVFFHIMKVSGPLNAMLVTLLIPVSAIVLGTTLLAETLLVRHGIGAAVIGLALIAIDGRLPDALRHRLSRRGHR